MLLGIILILCGLMIAVYPPLLSLIVAVLLIALGVITLMVGLNYKRAAKKFDDPFLDFFMKV